MMIDTTQSMPCPVDEICADRATHKATVYLQKIDDTERAPAGATHIADGQYYKLRGNRVFAWRDGWVNKRVNYLICIINPDTGKPRTMKWNSAENYIAEQSALKNAKNYTFAEAVRVSKKLGRPTRAVIRKVKAIAVELDIKVNFENGAIGRANAQGKKQ